MSKKIEDNKDLIDYITESYTRTKAKTPVTNRSIHIESDEQVYKLIRLNDEQFYVLHQNTIAISEDYFYLTRLFMNKDVIYSSFSKMYVTLKNLFGESGKYYDAWKGSFSFPFLLYFQTKDEEFAYIMNVCNIRSTIEFNIRKIIHANDEQIKRDIIHSPFDDFPKRKILYFISDFIGFLTEYFESTEGRDDNEFFFQTVESNLILFGYKNGAYFDKQYENDKEFHEAIQELTDSRNSIEK